MAEGIHTKRLILRRWQDSDLDAYAAICADPQVMQFISDGRPRSRAQTAMDIDAMELLWRQRGFGTFAVIWRDSGALVGSAGFGWHEFLPEIAPCIEIGWRFAAGVWGKRVATEAARAAFDHGIGALGLRDIHCTCQIRNAASCRIAEKLGLAYVRTVTAPTYRRRIAVYRQPPNAVPA